MDPLLSSDELAPPPTAAPGWMITFADLLSLLLAFFVMLFATTSIEQKDWQRVVGPISEYLSGRRLAPTGVALTPPVVAPAHGTAYVAALLDRLAAESVPLKGAVLTRDEHALRLSLPPAALSVGQQPAPLADLARLVAGLDNRLEIVVHAGMDPSPTAQPDADWQRSVGRAAALAGELVRLSGRNVAASAMLDLPAGTADQSELRVLDVAAEG